MSLSKHRVKKSSRNTLSGVSNSENLRNCLFQNDILCEIKNVSINHDDQYDRKSQVSQKSQKSEK